MQLHTSNHVRMQAYSWGGNEYGQCAQEAEEVLAPQPCLPHLKVRQVAAGGMHSCVLTTDGEVGFCQPCSPAR